MVIGTAAYMAPEQAKGHPVDKRADIWAYGAVLFEMLTGKKLFEAGDVSEILASVLVKDSDVSSIGSHVPAHILAVVRRCLVKDPKERLRDIGDVRLAMKEDAGGVGPGQRSAVVAPLRFWQRPVPALTTGVGIAAAAGLAGWIASNSDSTPVPEQDLVRFTIAPPDTAPLGFSVVTTNLAISPDGRNVVYQGPNLSESSGGNVGLHIRSIDELATAPLRGGEESVGPFFSPDGDWVGSVRNDDGRTLQKVSIFGGPPVALGQAPSIIRGASWGTDDQIVIGTAVSGLMKIPGGAVANRSRSRLPMPLLAR